MVGAHASGTQIQKLFREPVSWNKDALKKGHMGILIPFGCRLWDQAAHIKSWQRPFSSCRAPVSIASVKSDFGKAAAKRRRLSKSFQGTCKLPDSQTQQSMGVFWQFGHYCQHDRHSSTFACQHSYVQP